MTGANRPTPTSPAPVSRCAATGALQSTLDLAADYAMSAKGALADFGANPWRPALEDLADFAVARRA